MSNAETIRKCQESGDWKTLTNDIDYVMSLTHNGGCLVFRNNNNDQGYFVTVDIEGSYNLRIEDGDTNSKKKIKVEPGKKAEVICKILNSSEGPSISVCFSVSKAPSAASASVKDQWTDIVDHYWPKFDKDGNGHLDRGEAMRFVRQVFTGTTPSQFDSYFEMMDADGSGTIDKVEMANFMRENCS